MGAHYLVDNFHTPIGSSSLIDVRNPPSGESLVNGSFVVRVPDQLSVQNPVDLTDLLAKKYGALLAFYAGFTDMVFDDLMDASGLDLTWPSTNGVLSGDRSTVGLQGTFGVFQTVTTALPGGVPSQAVVTWECFEMQDADPAGGRLERTYVEVPASTYDCDVSFDNGANFNATMDGAVLNIPGPDQGNNLVLRFGNGAANKTFIGSWAVAWITP